MEEIRQFIELYNVELIIAMGVAFIVLLILYFRLEIRMSNMKKRYKELVRGQDKVSIEDIILRNGHEIDALKEQTGELQDFVKKLDDKFAYSVQKVGFIRYSAFNDMGTDLSFSISLLDDFLNGFVVTSIYNKGQSISYAKPIKGGKSIYPLSVEEMQSIDRAIKGDYASSF